MNTEFSRTCFFIFYEIREKELWIFNKDENDELVEMTIPVDELFSKYCSQEEYEKKTAEAKLTESVEVTQEATVTETLQAAEIIEVPQKETIVESTLPEEPKKKVATKKVEPKKKAEPKKAEPKKKAAIKTTKKKK
jgi:hypothetical protein